MFKIKAAHILVGQIVHVPLLLHRLPTVAFIWNTAKEENSGFWWTREH